MGLLSTMTLPQLGPAAQAWLEASARKTATGLPGRVRPTLTWAVAVYLVLELLGNPGFTQIFAQLFGMRPDPNQKQDFTLGIDHADASTLVGSLAAFVVTINVAVFAARLGGTSDIRGQLELARWQRAMESLPPYAALLAVAVAGTRFPSESVLGLSLMALAVLTLFASDVRVARRLGALKIEAEIAEIQYIYARDHLAKFRQSLPASLENRFPEVVKGYSTNIFGLLVWVILPVILQAFLMLYVFGHISDFDEQIKHYGIKGVGGFSAITEIGLLLIVTMSTTKMVRKSQPSGDAASGHKPSSMRPWMQELLIILGFPVLTMLMVPDSLKAFAAASTFAIFVIGYVTCRLGIRRGRGPAVIAVRMELARLNVQAEDARKRADAAKEERMAEINLHAALAAEAAEAALERANPNGHRQKGTWFWKR